MDNSIFVEGANMPKITVSVNKGRFSFTNNDYGWAVTIRRDKEVILRYILPYEPNWELPSELVHMIKEDVSSLLYCSDREEVMLGVSEYLAKDNEYDAAYLQGLINTLQAKIAYYEGVISRLVD